MPGVPEIPVERAGGRQDDGPWPDDVDDLVTGDTHTRPAIADDGSEREVSATVAEIVEDDDGTRVVTSMFDDPTLGGDS